MGGRGTELAEGLEAILLGSGWSVRDHAPGLELNNLPAPMNPQPSDSWYFQGGFLGLNGWRLAVFGASGPADWL